MTRDGCPVIFHDDFILSQENVRTPSYPVIGLFFRICSFSFGFFLLCYWSWCIWNSQGTIIEKRVTDLYLSEFLAYGPQRDHTKTGKTLVRKTKEGKVWNWNVENDAPACTLQEVFQQVKPCLGFNIEVKFDDNIIYQKEYLAQVLQTIFQVN